MNTIWKDLRFGARMLWKHRVATIVSVIVLALGIGANTAIFGVVNAVLLRPLPYPEASRLVFLGEYSDAVRDMSISMANFNDWRAQNTVFESMVAYQNDDVVMSGRGEPERLRLRRITAGFTPTLGVHPIVGRTLQPEDDKVGAERVVLLGEGLWERRFGRDQNIVGQHLFLDNEPYTIIGVFPARLHGSLRQTELFTSLWRLEDKFGGEANRGSHPGIYAYARLKREITFEQAVSEMKGIAKHLDELHPATNGNNSITVRPLLEAVVEDVRTPLMVLLVAAGFVLLIACVNIANLQLARATERYRELAVRMALGAGRTRLIRQILTESVLLALIGGALGLFLAVWITASLVHAIPAGVPRLDEVTTDRWVLIFSFLISMLTGVTFGIIPAFQVSRTDVQEALCEGGRTHTSGGGRRRLSDVLVAAEVAVSLILLVGAGLITKSLWKVWQADSGIRPDHVLTARVSLPDASYADEAKRRMFVGQVTARIQQLPGVEAAGFKNPLMGGWQNSYFIEGRPLPDPGRYPSADFTRVTPDAPRAMGMRLLRGRFFDAHDNERGQRVCIVDESFAKENFREQDPLGQRVAVGRPEPGKPPKWMTIVGVVAHVKNYGVDQASRVEIVIPNSQQPAYGGSIVVRSTSDPAMLASGISAAVHSIDPNIPVFSVRPLEEVIAENTASRRLSVTLIASFAALALVLAGVGVYGVTAYSVSQRNHEIGIRMALGASPRDVLNMIARHSVALAVIGIAAGIMGALALTRLMTTVLFHVSALDLSTYVAGAGASAVIILLASWVPARRATRVDPLVALRHE